MLEVEAWGGGGPTSDGMFDSDSGSVYAAVDFEPGPGIFKNNPHGHGMGDGFSHAFVGGTANNITAAAGFYDIDAGDDEHPLSRGYAENAFDAHAYGTFEVSDTEIDQSDFAWIEGTIDWVGAGDEDLEHAIKYRAITEGEIHVGDTHLYFVTDYDGDTIVNGTLMGLDGPHSYENVRITGGVVSLNYKQQVGPGEEVHTHSAHGVAAYVEAYQTEGNYSEGLLANPLARSTLRAYTGTPD